MIKQTLCLELTYTAQKMKFSFTEFFSKIDEIRSFVRIWSHLLKKSLMENFIFWAVLVKTLGVDISWFMTLTHYVPVSSDINEVIRAVLNFLFFFTKGFCSHKKYKKHKNANKGISDFFHLRCFLCAQKHCLFCFCLLICVFLLN